MKPWRTRERNEMLYFESFSWVGGIAGTLGLQLRDAGSNLVRFILAVPVWNRYQNFNLVMYTWIMFAPATRLKSQFGKRS